MAYYIPEENKEEILKVKNILDRFFDGIEYSDFLSPFTQNYVVNMLQKDYSYLFFIFYGGYKDSERKILAISNFDEIGEFPIESVLIESKNVLSHRQILGSLIGYGLKRSKVGDILVKDNRALLFVKSDISDYIKTHINKIGSDYVNIRLVKKEEVDIGEFLKKEAKKITCTVSSLRLDTVISHGFGISRNDANELVKQLKVAVNWMYIDKPSFEVKEGDLISVRHHGRLKVEKVLSVTKKGRITLELSRYS